VWITFSRTSNAMQFDSTGYLTYAPNNLLTYSNDPSNAVWGKTNVTPTGGVSDPKGGNNAWLLTTTGANPTLSYNISINNAGTVLMAVWLKSATGSSFNLKLWVNGSGTNPNPTFQTFTITTSWQQFSLPVSLASGGGSANFNLGDFSTGWANGNNVYMYAPTYSAVTYETTPRAGDQVITTSAAYYGPRFDYDPNTLAAKGLLIEGPSTNSMANSNGFTNTWGATNVAPTAAGAMSPDGTVNGWALTDNATNAQHILYQPGTVVASSTNTATIYAKQGTGRYLSLGVADTTQSKGGYAAFDLQTGNITQSGAVAGGGTLVSASSQNVGNGWYRLQVVATVGAGASAYIVVGTSNAATYTPQTFGQASYAGTGSTWFIYGAQLEAGSFATSYIPTAASAVTRAADVATLTGAALTALQGAKWSLIGEIDSSYISGSAMTIAQTGPVSVGSFLRITSNQFNWYASGGASLGSYTPGTTQRTGVALNGTNYSAALNGGAIQSGTSDFTGSGVSSAYLGSQSGSSAFLNGHVRSLAIYNTRLPDATLQAKSIVGAPY
jgi:hypothetical protein